MKKLPIGIQTLRHLIEDDYLYVDKTRDIYNLIDQGGKYNFLSRPRRFGKSLLVSTLEEIFSGNKELFKNLWIYDRIKWEKYPVLKIDFTLLNYKTPDQLEASLERYLEEEAEKYDITLNKEKNYKEYLPELIKKMAANGRVVLLVDEYDKPIIDHIENIERATNNRAVLKSFYETLKGVDAYLKFVFITGVSKFSKVSVFSGLNNLDDMTLDRRYPTIAGYTEEEIDTHFNDELEALGKRWNLNADELRAKVKRWYNGYSWDGKNKLYNPVSIHNLINQQEFSNYWFSTATPTFLLKLIRQKELSVIEFEDFEMDKSGLDSYEIENIRIAPLLFQTGYLTVSRVEMEYGEKTLYLSYPNHEVRESFLKHLLESFTDEAAIGSKQLKQLKKFLVMNDLPGFFKQMTSLFASLNYDMAVKDREGYYQTVIYLVLKLIGVETDTEVETNLGWLDAVIETATHIYIIEYKMGTAERALKQIKEKKYYEKYQANEKQITLVGVGFDMKAGNISGYKLETLTD
ncbi:MAG: ATP-binding protein [bacterium]|nr:ATP-binding protein [bacterium]